MIVDITIQAIVYVIISAAAITGIILGFWKNIVGTIGLAIFNDIDFTKINDESPLKIQYNNIQTLLKLQKESCLERQEIRAELLRMNIETGIRLDVGVDEVLKDYDRYKQIPTENGEQRNGYLQHKVENYIKKKIGNVKSSK